MTERQTGSPPRRVAVLGGNRIPFARVGGAYARSSNQDMLTAALEGLVARFGLRGEALGEVVAGAVLKHSADFNLVRETVLGSSLSSLTPGIDLQQACATGLEATVQAGNAIALGQLDSAVAGGVDSTSDAPMAVSDGLRRALLRASRARTLGQRAAAVAAIRPGDLAPQPPRVAEPRTGLSMGEHQALTTARWRITREDQDALALASHVNLAAAYDDGFFDDLLTPYRGLTRDETLRPDSTAEALAALRPVFGTALDTPPTMTAGNSTPLSDGASTVLLSSEEWARQRGIAPLAYLVDAQVAAVDYVHGDEGLLMAPAYAVPRLLARNGLGLADLDYLELHEAFAATVLATLAAWRDADFCRDRLGLDGPFGEVDAARLNVHGSSLAAGHPFAATGGRIVATLAKVLATAEVSGRPARGLVSVCAAGGQGVAVLMEAA